MKNSTTALTWGPARSLALRVFAILAAAGMLLIATLGWMSHNYRVTATYGPKLTLDERRALFEKALALNPAEGWAWWQLAKIDLSRRDLRGAQESAQRAIATFPRYMAYPLLAQILYTRSVTDASARHPALEAFDTALAINPGDWVLLNQAARVALWNHDAPRARRYLDQADHFQINARDPRAQNVETLLLRAELAMVEENYDEAQRLAERTLLLSPRSAAATLLLARVLGEHLGDAEHAYELLRDRWEVGLPPDYVRILTREAVERQDWETLFRVVTDLVEQQADEQEVDDTTGEMARAILGDAGETAISGANRREFLDAFQALIDQRLAEDPTDPQIELLAVQVIRPVWDAAQRDSDREAMAAVMTVLTACAQALDGPSEPVRVFLGEVSEAVRGAS